MVIGPMHEILVRILSAIPLSHLISFAFVCFFHLRVQRNLNTKLWCGLAWSMQHQFGTLTRKFRKIKLRKFRGEQSTGPSEYSETQVVLAKCLIFSIRHLLRPIWIGSFCFIFIRFVIVLRLRKKDKYLTPALSSKVTRSSHCRYMYQTYSDALKIPFILWTIPR